MTMRIIIASQSKARKLLLEKLGLTVIARPTNVDEEAIVTPDPVETIQKRAQAKAEAAIQAAQLGQFDQLVKFDEMLIIAADSMATLKGKSYGKPKDLKDAKQILTELTGQTHDFVTHTVCVHMKNGKEIKRWEESITSQVTMKPCSSEEIDEFIHTYKDLLPRFAACFALDDMPWDLVQGVMGSYTNVIGLPFETVLPVLRELKIIY